MPLNFVKFQRGSNEAYQALKTANRLESDALYFIYDKLHPDDGGLLYLGDVLIGGSGQANVESLGDLSDVSMPSPSTLLDGMILQYNVTTADWRPVSITYAIEHSGASMGGNVDLPIVRSVTKGNNDTIDQAIATVDADPIEGDIVFVSGVPYIYNGSSWQILTGSVMSDKVSALETAVSNLQSSVSGLSTALSGVQSQLATVDSRIATAVAGANHLTYSVLEENENLPTPTEQTVNQISKTVFLVPNGETTGENKYDEYMYVSGSYEKLGDWGVNLSNYVTTTTFESRVGSLETAMANLPTTLNAYVTLSKYNSEVGDLQTLLTATGKQSTTIVNEIIELQGRLQWNELDSNQNNDNP